MRAVHSQSEIAAVQWCLLNSDMAGTLLTHYCQAGSITNAIDRDALARALWRAVAVGSGLW